MKKLNYKKVLCNIILGVGILTSCNSNSKIENTNSLEEELMALDDISKVEVSKEEIFNLIESFPSPIEMASVIKNNKIDISSDMLLSTDSINRFATSYDKAMALGAYGSDMGYINIYDKIFLIPDFLESIVALSEDLDLDGFFDFVTMFEMAENSENIDVLIQMSTESFNEMEAHLREKGRDELSLLIVFGTWLEGASVISEIAKKEQTKLMFNRVAEQKEFVNNLNKIFESSSDDYFNNLTTKINPLIKLYEQIKIEFIMKEATMEEIDGQLVFIDNSETIIIADDKVILEIINKTIEIRNDLLK
tara:strand:- start:239 stop:1156 length:918 start_codon:yes stop_codon:yes gene_type:complete